MAKKTAMENTFLGEVFSYVTEDGRQHTAMMLYADKTEDSYIFGKSNMAYNHIGYMMEDGSTHHIDTMFQRYSETFSRMDQKVLEAAIIWNRHGAHTGYRVTRHYLVTEQEYAEMRKLSGSAQGEGLLALVAAVQDSVMVKAAAFA